MTSTRIPLRCACCHIPYAELQQTATGAWVLVIQARHFHGQIHTNVLTVAGLDALLREGLVESDQAVV